MNLVHTKQDRFSQKLVIDRALFLPNRNIYFDWSAKADPVGITDITIITLKGKSCVVFLVFFRPYPLIKLNIDLAHLKS